jgi:hypothetical protein
LKYEFQLLEYGSGCVFIALRTLVLPLKRAGRPRVASAARRLYVMLTRSRNGEPVRAVGGARARRSHTDSQSHSQSYSSTLASYPSPARAETAASAPLLPPARLSLCPAAAPVGRLGEQGPPRRGPPAQLGLGFGFGFGFGLLGDCCNPNPREP